MSGPRVIMGGLVSFGFELGEHALPDLGGALGLELEALVEVFDARGDRIHAERDNPGH